MLKVLRGLIAAALVALLAAPLGAAEKLAVPAFSQIPVDLTLPIIDRVLPFDVPFLFTGTTPTGAKSLIVKWVDITRRAKETQHRRAARGVVEPEFACPDIADADAGWSELRTILGGNGTFVIQVPRLEANHYFCFNFETIRAFDATALAAFRAQAALRIDERLRDVSDAFLDDTAARNLRLALVELVKPTQSNARLDPKPNSIFETEENLRDPRRHRDAVADAAAIEEKFRAIVRPLRQYHAQRKGAIQTFRNFAGVTISEFLKLVDEMPAFHTLTGQVSAAAAPAAIRTLVADALPLLQRYDSLTPAELADLPWGGPRNSEPEILAWSASELDVRMGRLTTFQGELRTIRAALQTLNTPPRVTALAGGLTAAQLTELGTQIDTVLSTLTTEIEVLGSLKIMLDRRQAEINGVVKDLSAVLIEDVLLLSTSVGDFSTRHSWYLSADIGIVWAWTLDEMVPYAGMNIYFRPVNKDAPLQEFGSFATSFTRRFSALVGVTVAGDLVKTGERAALFSDNRMLILGAGLRLTDSIRFTGGAVILKAFDPNPLVDHKQIKAAPFISFSVDWNVRDAFVGLTANAPPPAPPPAPAPAPVTPPAPQQ